MNHLYSKVAAAGMLVTTATLLSTKPAAAQTTAICQSVDYEPAICAMYTRRGVVLEKEYSNATCRGNWGYKDGIVWVENGCRARFRVAHHSDSYNKRGAHTRQRNCSHYCSEKGDREYYNQRN